MLTPQSLIANALWIFSLAGVLATFSYLSWYRGLHRWPWRFVLGLPRLLAPLCLSLTFFCLGMALSGFFAFQPAPWWQLVAWGLLTILFLVQAVVYFMGGCRQGWDKPMEEGKQP